jgi:hypothetical protein
MGEVEEEKPMAREFRSGEGLRKSLYNKLTRSGPLQAVDWGKRKPYNLRRSKSYSQGGEKGKRRGFARGSLGVLFLLGFSVKFLFRGDVLDGMA